MLLSVSEGGLINGTDVKSGTSVFEYEYDTARIEALGYDAEAQRLFAGTFDRRIHIFSIEKCFLPLATTTTTTTTTSVAADSKHNTNSTTAQISRPTDEPKIEYIVPDYTQAPTVKTGRRGGHFQPRFCHTLLGPEGSIRCLVYNEGTQTLYGSSFDGAVYAWTIADQHREQYSELQYKLSVGAETLNTMALTEDASILVTGDATGTVLVWSLADKAVVFGFKAHLDTVNGVVLTNNGRIVTYSEDETMIMWRLDYQE
jgi:WD40 repeat protein